MSAGVVAYLGAFTVSKSTCIALLKPVCIQNLCAYNQSDFFMISFIHNLLFSYFTTEIGFTGRVSCRLGSGVAERANSLQGSSHQCSNSGLHSLWPCQDSKLADCRAASRHTVGREWCDSAVLQEVAPVHWPTGTGKQMGQKHGELSTSLTRGFTHREFEIKEARHLTFLWTP